MVGLFLSNTKIGSLNEKIPSDILTVPKSSEGLKVQEYDQQFSSLTVKGLLNF